MNVRLYFVSCLEEFFSVLLLIPCQKLATIHSLSCCHTGIHLSDLYCLLFSDIYSFRISGTASRKVDEYPVPNQGVIRSPGFPDAYAHNQTIYSYLLHGYSTNDRIHIVFDDFDINPYYSFLEVCMPMDDCLFVLPVDTIQS